MHQKNFLIHYCVTILLNLLKRFFSATVFILLKLNVVNLQIGFGSKTIVSYNKRGRTIKDTRRKQFCQLSSLNSGTNVEIYPKMIQITKTESSLQFYLMYDQILKILGIKAKQKIINSMCLIKDLCRYSNGCQEGLHQNCYFSSF